ncbi:MAG TPA: S41 family peptidase [Vicinamibacterales bacterium]|nr:S41 family peptidase [Vicinamibacterales bacterium]
MFKPAAAVLLAGVLAHAQPPAPTISKFDKGASLTMLRQIKADLRDNYFDKTYRGMDLDGVFGEAERRLKASSSSIETTTILADVLLRLNDSHTMFIPPDRVTRVDYGWAATIVGDEPFVLFVKEGSDARKKGMAQGDRILFWNRNEPNRRNLWQLNYYYTYIRPQVMQRVIVRKPGGAEQVLDIASKTEARPNQLSDFLEEILTSTEIKIDREQKHGDTLIWKYTAFGDRKAVERAMKIARGAKSLIIDLRGNGGGLVDTLNALVSHLFDREVHVVTETGRKGEKVERAKGRRDAFRGPLIVLVDSRSASAAEILARLVQVEKRGSVIGDRTAGAVMTSRVFPHALGIESIALYATSITVGDVRMSNGESLEHKGVTPDEILLPTGADMAAGRDPVLARALTLLGGAITAEQAGSLYRK